MPKKRKFSRDWARQSQHEKPQEGTHDIVFTELILQSIIEQFKLNSQIVPEARPQPRTIFRFWTGSYRCNLWHPNQIRPVNKGDRVESCDQRVRAQGRCNLPPAPTRTRIFDSPMPVCAAMAVFGGRIRVVTGFVEEQSPNWKGSASR